jgi:uncharacterized repeat protein (TIGR01451 family)
MKLFFDIIPPKEIRKEMEKIEKKTPNMGLLMKKLIIKTTCLLIIISLNWVGLSAVWQTFGFFSNTEGSPQNIFTAGVLDFELQSLTDFPDVCSNEPTERTISIVNYGNPFKYVASSAEFSGDVCDYVTLEANVDGGEPEYVGPLTGFNYGPLDFSEPDDWVLKATFNPDLPAGLLGQICTFKFVFDGSQTKNDLPFGQGFSDKEEIVSNITPKVCCYTEIRSCGYWKTHQSVYSPHLPQTLGGYPTDEIVNTVTKANNILTAACGTCGCGCDETMRAKLKGQLLAMKFNIAHFGIGDYLVESAGKTLNQIVADADNLLRLNPPPPDSVLEKMKDLLDQLNNLEHIRFCAVTLPPEGCVLQLTKTSSSDEVNRGETITYHLTFDNIGNEVCTGGGVQLKDTFDGSLLKYLEYTSTRNPKSFNKSTNYVEWNFGNIYPEDPLIEIDLRMKVAGSAKCDSTITNSANYWSNETDWGEPVTVDTHVICPPVPDTGIVINEFLPNPVGKDNKPKPNGEWVELYNKGASDVDVAGWVLYDENDANELPITSSNTNTGSTIVAAGGFLVVYRNGDSDFALDNTGGDTVRLYDGAIGDGANLIDSHTYTINASEGKSFARIPDGSNDWVDPIPTPGEPNVMDMIGVEIGFGPALPEEGEKGYEEIKDENEISSPPETPAEITGGVSGGIGTSEEQPVVEEPTSEQSVEEPVVEESVTEETPAEEPVTEETTTDENPAMVEETPVIEEPATLPENEILNELSNGNSSVTSPESAPETPSETTSETAPEVPAETPAEAPSPTPEI